jgi:AraC family transcriptional regulator
MEPKIITIPAKFLVGVKAEMSLAKDRTPTLWQSFMPRRGEVANRSHHGFYSVQNYYPDTDFSKFTPLTLFEKWAAVEVYDHGEIPEGMEGMILPAGSYAVFNYHGTEANFHKTANLIYGKLIPESGLLIDRRPHFTLMPPDYKRAQINSEEIWVPVQNNLS